MPDGAYLALNGLKTRLTELDALSSDLANVGTVGYKRAQASTHGSERSTFDVVLQKATDPTTGDQKIDLRSGEISPTGRDLDFAIDGPGFFVINTPSGPRYTRNGNFERRADGTLTTIDGIEVEGQGGPIRLATGPVTVDPDGTVRAGETAAGRLQIVNLAPGSAIAREGAARFRIATVTPVDKPTVRGSALEHSNVSVVESLAHLTALTRGFDSLQRGLVSLMSEVDGKAIAELGRR
jgi:flagellar basal body rod protein FlgG